MSSVIVSGDTSGSISITAPLVAGSGVLTLPTGTDTLVGKATTDTLTNKTLTAPVLSGSLTGTYTLAGTGTLSSPIISGTPTGVGVLTSGTAVASTSGTSIDFTGIPSWVKRITVMLNGVSTNGTSNILVRLGNSGGVVATGYVSQAAILSAAARSTTGFIITQEMSTGGLLYGQFICNLQNSATNAWSGSAALDKDDNNAPWSAGALTTMASVCTTVRITTVGGTNTFDAGSINIMYE